MPSEFPLLLSDRNCCFSRILYFWCAKSVLLFALTAAASMIPVVGAAIVYVPVCVYMIAEGNTGAGLGWLPTALLL
jgi:predicted PurR-regulated permease PerM